MTDDWAEFMTGREGAVSLIGKLVIMPMSLGRMRTQKEGLDLVAIFGTAYSQTGKLVLPENDGLHEMWECEITIKPIRKFSAYNDPDGSGRPDYTYNGYRADQILCSNFGDHDNWGRQYFGPPPAPADKGKEG